MTLDHQHDHADTTLEESVRRTIADRMAFEAQAFLDSLNVEQRALAAWEFPSTVERQLWFYTPTDHGGLALAEMGPAQQRIAMRLIASGLSRAGYVTVSTIIGLDNVLDELEGWVMSWGRERGRDPGRYYLRIFGDPSRDANWSWRFGGHHVSLNPTIIDRKVVSMTPCFMGADPASSPLLGPHPLRPLAGVEDYARELIVSLTSEQRAIALVSEVAPVDLVGANRPQLRDGDVPLPLERVWRSPFDGENGDRVRAIQAAMEANVGLQPQHIDAVRFTVKPKGINVARLTPPQKTQLRKVLDAYLYRMPDPLAEIESGKFSGDRLDQLSFLWAGGLQSGEGHYYRIQGPRLVVEYDNSARNANHVHTVWRDLDGDFAHDAIASHYATTPHHV
jgi:hypothetical protein